MPPRRTHSISKPRDLNTLEPSADVPNSLTAIQSKFPSPTNSSLPIGTGNGDRDGIEIDNSKKFKLYWLQSSHQTHLIDPEGKVIEDTLFNRFSPLRQDVHSVVKDTNMNRDQDDDDGYDRRFPHKLSSTRLKKICGRESQNITLNLPPPPPSTGGVSKSNGNKHELTKSSFHTGNDQYRDTYNYLKNRFLNSCAEVQSENNRSTAKEYDTFLKMKDTHGKMRYPSVLSHEYTFIGKDQLSARNSVIKALSSISNNIIWTSTSTGQVPEVYLESPEDYSFGLMSMDERDIKVVVQDFNSSRDTDEPICDNTGKKTITVSWDGLEEA